MLFFWFRHVSLYYAGLEKEISTSGVGPVAQEIEHKFGVYKKQYRHVHMKYNILSYARSSKLIVAKVP